MKTTTKTKIKNTKPGHIFSDGNMYYCNWIRKRCAFLFLSFAIFSAFRPTTETGALDLKDAQQLTDRGAKAVIAIQDTRPATLLSVLDAQYGPSILEKYMEIIYTNINNKAAVIFTDVPL